MVNVSVLKGLMLCSTLEFGYDLLSMRFVDC